MTIRSAGAVLLTLLMLTACSSGAGEAPMPARTASSDAVVRIVEEAMARDHLKAVIIRVTEDGQEVLTRAFGESMTGVPARTDMHFRNGAVAISYVAALLFRLVEQGIVGLDDTLARWLPDIPHADRVTLRQLAQMTSGYADYVLGNEAFQKAFDADPFRQWSPDELLRYAISAPLYYPPGTNWNYAHTNYVLLGLALEKATGRDMAELLDDVVLGPLGLTGTANAYTAQIPAPALHAFTSERRAALGIPKDTAFYEESTFWNPSWTITRGAVQTTTIHDMATGAAAIGSGALLTPESYRTMTAPDLRGRTSRLPGCPTCAPQTEGYTYGVGIVISGGWLLQNPMFAGQSGVAAYLPAKKIAIAIAVTYLPEAFDDDGDYPNAADALFRKVGAELAPDDAPPTPPGAPK